MLCHCGSVLVRRGINELTPHGTDWIALRQDDSPFSNFTQISIGETLAYALDLQGQVFMRVGIEDEYPTGRGWLKVLKDLKHISLSKSRQVCINF